ncbi:D-sedoheptulose-7-phosphate isomerase [Rathayibacter iranicus]|uniref:SIS domain-containing protein n=2 Tax=Rathayibacter iranicus TaxID=59737 RepID=A0AAD1EL55_9MICO|nr:SIS domain-containing protein [Rathayibacter iranicus]AZZ54688.1 SIS domain-containing protein [Rathayibacter iranicus]MWV30474.1 SIS domain-containing protein [Rathayibacter iranicus NCPPB 2253 = VKM Ac-1602]PPI51051.1 phosphoheptose isomerase [Rathayibacter iranicus]PPI63467.1 phosphoheptose isomerase [Rathayibacter iranicus]PPI74177.1 phosphoheptose isomerase [Rathayibacter iranicus]
MTIDTVLDTPTDAVRRLVDDHVARSLDVVAQLERHSERIAAWGTELADRLHSGARLLAAGNGGSAAEAQHLTAELVGRFDGDRIPFSAISLHAETSSLTAIGNDYGFEHVFARQVTAHARTGDVVVLLSTSGRSANLLRAAEAARAAGARSWALTGGGPNPLTELCDESIALDGHGANVQEAQLVLVHALCRAFEHRIRARTVATS